MLPGRGDECSRYPREQHENVPECTRLDPFTSPQRACVGRWDSFTIAMGCIEALIAFQRRSSHEVFPVRRPSVPRSGLPSGRMAGPAEGKPGLFPSMAIEGRESWGWEESRGRQSSMGEEIRS